MLVVSVIRVVGPVGPIVANAINDASSGCGPTTANKGEEKAWMPDDMFMMFDFG